MNPRERSPREHPLWYKDAVIYQIHVKAFHDSNGDGIGDFRGLTSKLDYLEDLGINAIWLLPFYPSPLKDDGYDISDYLDIHPDYGTLKEFQSFLMEAHKRGIRVITELVINHTSDQHPWFQRARRARPGSIERDFYVWSDTPEKYGETRIIFKDFEVSNWTLDPIAKRYYWHRFYHHQPDLNFDNPHVQEAVIHVMDYWLKMGVDGLRLDAVPYLFERDGTHCENLPESHQFLKRLRARIDETYQDRMLLAEANQWPEDAAAYFGKGDECHMAFHFPLMPRIFMAVKMEDRFPIIDILGQTPPIPDGCQWAIFLRNHDELTLEMVTDEERDYMYRVYAKDPKARINLGIRRRLAPLLDNDLRKIELVNLLLLSLPGTPVIYYGDEIGMGDNYSMDDRNGVRTPMQWSADKNAGFSMANRQQLYLPVIIDPVCHYKALNVENQEKNQASLLWWMKRMIVIRKQLKALGRGGLHFLSPDNPKVLAFVRSYEEEQVLIVANLSSYSQSAELDLARYPGLIPEEVFSHNMFPIIKETPYLLTLGAYGSYLFYLKKPASKPVLDSSQRDIPELGTVQGWESLLQGMIRNKFEQEILPSYLSVCRWFAGKGRRISGVNMIEQIPVGAGGAFAWLLQCKVQYTEGLFETYLLPLAFASGDAERQVREAHPTGIIATLKIKETAGIIYDAVYEESFRRNLLFMIVQRQRVQGLRGKLLGSPGKAFRKVAMEEDQTASHVLKGEQSNTSLLYPNGLILKLYRRLEEGINPDLEIGRFLTGRSYPNIPPFAGQIAYKTHGSEPITIGLLQGFVPNQGDAWRYTQKQIERYMERVLTNSCDLSVLPENVHSQLALAYQEIPLIVQELIGEIYLGRVAILGRRTAELHLSLSSDEEESGFAPEPFTALYQRSLYQSFQNFAQKVFRLLKKNIKKLPNPILEDAKGLLEREDEIQDQYKTLIHTKISCLKIRIHGDYHLGQVLLTGNDFVIIDFEGEPSRSLGERRLKRSALRDVAGMLRSFHYAAYHKLFHPVPIRPADPIVLAPWADLWNRYVGGVFLRSYLDTVGDKPILPAHPKELEILLHAFLLNKAIYELEYELNNRPEWVMLPLTGIVSILDMQSWRAPGISN